MRRLGLMLLILAMALPIAAWADEFPIVNQYGTIAISDMSGTNGMGTIGATTITSKGSQLAQWNRYSGHLGTLSFATGALESGTVAHGGVFAGGGYFDIVGIGAWMKRLTHGRSGRVDLFTGSFEGPVDWTLVRTGQGASFYVLAGSIRGMSWNGRIVGGTTTQSIGILNKGQLYAGIGHIGMGVTQKNVPEPETWSLMGAGILAVGGMFRRKAMGIAGRGLKK